MRSGKSDLNLSDSCTETYNIFMHKIPRGRGSWSTASSIRLDDSPLRHRPSIYHLIIKVVLISLSPIARTTIYKIYQSQRFGHDFNHFSVSVAISFADSHFSLSLPRLFLHHSVLLSPFIVLLLLYSLSLLHFPHVITFLHVFEGAVEQKL